MSDKISLLITEVDEFILFSDELSTYITLEKIAKEDQKLDLNEIHLKRINAFRKLKNWWKKIELKYNLSYSSEHQYEIDVVDLAICKKQVS